MTTQHVPTTTRTADRQESLLPPIGLPAAPDAQRLWRRVILVATVVLAFFLLDRLALLLMNYWLLESLGFSTVFWTNFWAGAALFGVSLAATTAAVAAPAFLHPLSPAIRKRALAAGVLAGVLDDVVIGAAFSSSFRKYLLFFNAQPFGEVDPVFGHDLGFYVFKLPAIWMTWLGVLLVLVFALVSSIVCATLARRDQPRRPEVPRFAHAVGIAASPPTRAIFAVTGLVAAAGVWLHRYNLLNRDNYSSSIPAGAGAQDVTGIFSTLNAINVSTAVLVFAAVALTWKLGHLHRFVTDPDAPADRVWPKRLGIAAFALILLPGLGLDVGFKGLVHARDQLRIAPNEPVVQFPYIAEHVNATNTAWGLDDVEVIPFVPAGPGDPLPDVDELLASPAIRNVPLWPGFVSRLERLLDPQHAERIFQTGGDEVIYGTTRDVFAQEQKLRAYYNFMDVDHVVYEIDGEKTLFASAVRELPLVEPQPWLAWWGQEYLLFTHGHGLVAAYAAQISDSRGVEYAASGIPHEAAHAELEVDQPGIYYGEGSGSMAYTNVAQIDEFDFPTDQGRADVRYPENIEAGVHMDSLLKRVVFGWKSRQFLDVVFSGLIIDDTRVHYYRMPLERIEQAAPFLFVDSDPYAVVDQGAITWITHGMTTTDRYPYSKMMDLGDKSVIRSPHPQAHRWVNYAADSVKVSLDAYTGALTFHKVADEPIADAWAQVYPDLFADGAEMPASLRRQVQYPTQLFHTQFDDLYIYYHMRDPLEFFNLEDMWDDGDEVLGPVLDTGAAITFSMEPYNWIAEPGGVLPASDEDTQFALSMIFTPENAKNLRAIATAYQDGDDYGRLHVLAVPKGHFYPGPEQADAAIDQDTEIAAQFALWNRQGTDVIRGHTTPLVVGEEVIYVEPIFTRSEQNPVPQLTRVAVVFRGEAALGLSLEDALRAALDNAAR